MVIYLICTCRNKIISLVCTEKHKLDDMAQVWWDGTSDVQNVNTIKALITDPLKSGQHLSGQITCHLVDFVKYFVLFLWQHW